MPHYFDQSPQAASRPASVSLDVDGRRVDLAVDRGVFAAGGVDPGTVELLRSRPAVELSGDVLDLGCGYGPIAIALAARHPAATVWAVDVNERARRLALANAAAAGVGDRVRVVAPDDVPADVDFSAIWSNPPIRIGKDALHELLLQWLGRLRAGGSARLVVHKYLGSDSLARWLGEQGWDAARLASRKGYRILEVRAR